MFHWLVAWPNSLLVLLCGKRTRTSLSRSKPRFQAHKKAEQMKERDEQDVVSLHENSLTLLTWRKVLRREKKTHSLYKTQGAHTLMLLLRF